jgi:alpha-beta hydrolase superfamily lysophospholipase
MNLNSDFKTDTIRLAPDFEGEVIATLISSKFNKGNRKAVLYVHGFIDYFFHPHVCEAFHENDFDFYALDLRKCGRSILPHQRPNYCENIEEYFEEITASIDAVKLNGCESLYLLGHSTGGLTTSCYMNSGKLRNEIKGLILNSPFLAMPQSHFLSELFYTAAKTITKFAPDGKLGKGLSPIYAQSMHKGFYGEWDFNLDWKPIDGFPVYFKWEIAIVDAQRSLNNSNIQVPILLLHSSKSLKPKEYSPQVMQADIVLDVKNMKEIGAKLGKNVTLAQVENGQHDLFLSPKTVRETALKEMFNWLA